MFAAECLERSLELRIHTHLLLPCTAGAAVQAHAVAGLLVGETPTGGGQAVVVAVDVHLVHCQPQAPVVAEFLFEAGERVQCVLRVAAPARGAIGGAGKVGLLTIAVEQRERHRGRASGRLR